MAVGIWLPASSSGGSQPLLVPVSGVWRPLLASEGTRYAWNHLAYMQAKHSYTKLKVNTLAAVREHAFNPSTKEAEIGGSGSLSSKPPWVPRQPGIPRETPAWKRHKTKQNKTKQNGQGSCRGHFRGKVFLFFGFLFYLLLVWFFWYFFF